MIRFKQLFEEKVFPDELYHGTDSDAFFNIVRDDRIKLTYTGLDGQDKEINEEMDYYFSMSTDKFGRYMNLGTERVGGMISSNTLLVMDTNAMNSRGKLIDVEYWGGSYSESEKEVRFISNDRFLDDASKYIKEAHIYVDPQEYFNMEEITIKRLSKINDSDIPVYFYDDTKPFRMTLKAKSKSLKDIIDAIINVKRKESRPSGIRGRESRMDAEFTALYNLITGEENKTEEQRKEYESLKEDLEHLRRGSDTYNVIGNIRNAVHNVRRSNHPLLQKFSRVLRDLGIRNSKDLAFYLKEKIYGKD